MAKRNYSAFLLNKGACLRHDITYQQICVQIIYNSTTRRMDHGRSLRCLDDDGYRCCLFHHCFHHRVQRAGSRFDGSEANCVVWRQSATKTAVLEKVESIRPGRPPRRWRSSRPDQRTPEWQRFQQRSQTARRQAAARAHLIGVGSTAKGVVVVVVTMKSFDTKKSHPCLFRLG